MKLPPENLSVHDKLGEFDQWLTAKLDRIKDSVKFESEIDALCDCIEKIAPLLDDFTDLSSFSIDKPIDKHIDKLCDAVEQTCQSLVKGGSFHEDEERVAEFLDSFFNLLFLVTGATDNNLKNHFTIQLKEKNIKPLMPKRNSGRKVIKFTLQELPSTIKSNAVSKLLAACEVGGTPAYSKIVKTEPIFSLDCYMGIFLREYTRLILEDREDLQQLWVICHAYLDMQKKDLGRYLLNACTIFKVRGSVSASGGHITEDILRGKLHALELRPDIDYNTTDVPIGVEEIVEGGKRKAKTRAYDFILPYQIEGWEPKPKLFIQSQFYAGDSGSVSHKVVDQTKSSRQFTTKKYPSARFVEYLDGAGYYAALRGDLEHMLTFPDTASFFQVRSILTRLRRELQIICFVTPIEIEHVVLTRPNCRLVDIVQELTAAGYPREEVQRALAVSKDLGYIKHAGSWVTITAERLPIARRLLILDIVAKNGTILNENQVSSQRFLMIPGYGANYGILDSDLSALACSLIKAFTVTAYDFTSDIAWLIEQGVMRRF